MMILEIIARFVVLFIIGAGFYCALAYFLAFSILLFDGKFLKFVEWNVHNKWCFPTYYMSILSIGIIVHIIGYDESENITKLKEEG